MKILSVLLLVIIISLLMFGCFFESDVSEDVSGNNATVTDMIGRSVSIIPGSYSRVVCIGAGAVRMFSYICDSNMLCGIEDIDNTSLKQRPRMFDSVARPYLIANEQKFASLKSCGTGGPNAQTAEAERILTCNPDIVISAYEDVEKENALQKQLGIPVITLRTGPDGVFDEAFADSLSLLGLIFNRESRARQLIDYVVNEKNEIQKRTENIPDKDRPAVYICGLGNWGTTDYLSTAQYYAPFTIANIKNAVTDLSATGVQPIEKEKFEAIGPSVDIMIIDSAAIKNIIPVLNENPSLFDTCKAYRNNKVYLQMSYNAYFTNFELSLANTWFVASVVYPELFSDIDMKEKTDEITEMFLGDRIADEIFACPASYGGYGNIDISSLN